MKPVAIFRHAPTEGPGYFAEFLEHHQISWSLLPIDEGVDIPEHADHFSGLCFMGGPMSVNDPLPWIEPVCRLIRHAVEQNIPVIGHCLGGQLMSKALGGQITRNPVKEIGWSVGKTIGYPEPSPITQFWLGPLSEQAHPLFQWHGETFSLPPGAELLLETAACRHQAFALGPHLGMQCHIEMTEEMIRVWCEQWAEECRGLENLPSIQTPQEIFADIPPQLPALRRLADQLYGQWVKNLKP